MCQNDSATVCHVGSDGSWVVMVMGKCTRVCICVLDGTSIS